MATFGGFLGPLTETETRQKHDETRQKRGPHFCHNSVAFLSRVRALTEGGPLREPLGAFECLPELLWVILGASWVFCMSLGSL